MDEWKKPVRDLAGMVVTQGEMGINLVGQMKVVVQALAAIVRSHPDPEAFAREMRRAWMQAESSHEEGELDAQHLAGIESVLDVLEGNCPVPLNIRAPGKATPPEH